MTKTIDVEFSLAMHNRTGKYFIGKDLIDTPGIPLGQTLYWRNTKFPNYALRKISGRLQLWQIKAHTRTARRIERFGALLPRRTNESPLLHVDPLTVPTVKLNRHDIVMCHDMGPLTHPNLFARDVGDIYRWIYNEIAAVGPHVVFVSQATNRQFIDLYPNAKLASARVIYPAIHLAERAQHVSPPDSIERPFLLTVGSIGLRKNQQRCIEAFERSGLASEGVRYVVCGGKEPGYEAVADSAARTAGVILLPYVEDKELAWLYGNAIGFVLVSQLEGFGMPVAESIAHNLVPLVTRNSVLGEVAGDHALEVESENTESIAARMRDLVHLAEDERADRLAALHESIERFKLEDIQDQWLRAFDEWTQY